MYGDSLTAGFPSYEPYAKSLSSALVDAGISAEVIGCGLCGLTAVEMASGVDSSQLQDQFCRKGPGLRKLLDDEGPFDLVVIMAGTNDLGVPDTSAEAVLCSLKTIHEACWTAGTPTVALSIPESKVTGTVQYPEGAKKWHAINDALARWATAKEGDPSLKSSFLVNSATLVSFDDAALARGLWHPDSLHFTSAGSREFGSKLAPIVASHLFGPKTSQGRSSGLVSLGQKLCKRAPSVSSPGSNLNTTTKGDDPRPKIAEKLRTMMEQKLSDAKKFLSSKRTSLKGQCKL